MNGGSSSTLAFDIFLSVVLILLAFSIYAAANAQSKSGNEAGPAAAAPGAGNANPGLPIQAANPPASIGVASSSAESATFPPEKKPIDQKHNYYSECSSNFSEYGPKLLAMAKDIQVEASTSIPTQNMSVEFLNRAKHYYGEICAYPGTKCNIVEQSSPLPSFFREYSLADEWERQYRNAILSDQQSVSDRTGLTLATVISNWDSGRNFSRSDAGGFRQKVESTLGPCK